MSWHLTVRTRDGIEDSAAAELERELVSVGLAELAPLRCERLYLLSGDGLTEDDAHRLAEQVLCDPVTERYELVDAASQGRSRPQDLTVTRKPGVMDPVVASILRAASHLELPLATVRVGRAYRFSSGSPELLEAQARRLLANPVVDDILIGRRRLPAVEATKPHVPQRVEVPLAEDDEGLMAQSRELGLALNLEEMRTIRGHYIELERDPTDVELETLAQTWSEHCKHKTFAALVEYKGERIDNLLKSTIFRATRELDRDFCVSVFVDNAGIIRFDDEHNLCFKVETHNHPSAIEPYGGAGTGLGGVIRDILGTGLGGKPLANIDVFCVGDLRAKEEDLPPGASHPMRILKGVVAGISDYGNRMGIPTVTGGVFVDPRYTGNPLVYCGTVGIIPRDRCEKKTYAGDHIVALGGATGRDGIHGATFSSMELHEESEQLDGGAVQIGNAITEKRTMDVVLEARDRGLFRNVTDCGAGGFSSAVGEMGEESGARVELGAAPLKYPGLAAREIWISEAQERMVLGVPPDKLDELLELCASEDVEACVLGEFTDTGRLEISHDGILVADLDMSFLHDGLPRPLMQATWDPPEPSAARPSHPLPVDLALLRILAMPNVASKEWIIRQYDHEVQSGSAVKPLVGARSDGPGDAAVIAPVLGSKRAFAMGSGMNPLYGDLDPAAMAEAAIDESIRNVVSVGGDPDHAAILDNFSWGNTAKPDRLGALVRASQGCYDAAMALRTPFISGKDSLNNEYATGGESIRIPHSLLVSAVAIVEDLTRCTTMDAKAAGNTIFLVGETKDELGGSHYMAVHGEGLGDSVPRLNQDSALEIHRRVARVIKEGLARSVHDCSEGGLAVAAAEMAFAGDVGMTLTLPESDLDETALLFSESLSRYLIEVEDDRRASFEAAMEGLPCIEIGRCESEARFRVLNASGTALAELELDELRDAHQSLNALLEGERHG